MTEQNICKKLGKFECSLPYQLYLHKETRATQLMASAFYGNEYLSFILMERYLIMLYPQHLGGIFCNFSITLIIN